LQAFVAYLDDYARRNDLDVRPGVEAERVDRNGPEGWRVLASGGEWLARNVVVATGWDAEAKLPEWAANFPFEGELLHTSELRGLAGFAGRRVLVVGAGNSGVDVAGLLVRADADVSVSMRRALSGSAPPASTVLRIRALRGRAYGAPLTLEPRTRRSEAKGQARACRDRTRASPCTT
jgi:cation diffusion facilitator CzcD-associated flavoprotein CzcO